MNFATSKPKSKIPLLVPALSFLTALCVFDLCLLVLVRFITFRAKYNANTVNWANLSCSHRRSVLAEPKQLCHANVFLVAFVVINIT